MFFSVKGIEMKRSLTFIMIFAFFAMFLSSANADWSVRLGEDGTNVLGFHSNFTKVDFFITSKNSSTWTSQGLTNISAPGWTASVVNPTYATTSGPPATDTVYWNLNFTGNIPTTVFKLDYLVYTGHMITAAYSLQFKDGQLKFWMPIIPDLRKYNRNPAPVPLPGTLLLFASGLLGFWVIKRKFFLGAVRQSRPAECIPFAR
jgi:hypothetical protein